MSIHQQGKDRGKGFMQVFRPSLQGRASKLILLFTLVFSSFFVFRYLNHKTTFYGDASGYYMYLPSTFIFHNLTNYDPYPKGRGIPDAVMLYRWQSQRRDEKDTIFNQYTYGVALMELPFFAAAHALELARGSLANGYTASYEIAIKISTLFYALLGLILIYKVLRRFYDETPAMCGTVLILLATNMLWFTVFQTGMSHVPLLFLYALLIYLTIKVHERPATRLFIALGLTAGMITVIRPTDVVCLLIPLFYDVYSIESIRRKVRLIAGNAGRILLMAAVFALPILPQLVYWKAMTGHYLFYSYRDQSFTWTDPKIVEGMFHFSNGWLPYTPLMVLGLLGMLCLRQIKRMALSMWTLVPLYIYIIYCWYCFTYINGLGSRPMLHMYPLLAISLTAILVFLWRGPLVVRAITTLVVLFCIALNVDYCNRQERGILLSEESNFQFNFQMMFRNTLRYKDLVANDVAEFQPDTSKLERIGTFAEEHYDDSTSEYTVPDPITGHKYVCHMVGQEHLKKSIAVFYSKEKFAGAKWLKCSGRFLCTTPPDYFRHLLVIDLGGKKWKGCKIENKNFVWRPTEHSDHLTLFDFRLNVWGYVYFFTRIPGNLNENDLLKLFVWSPNMTEMYADDLRIELYK